MISNENNRSPGKLFALFLEYKRGKTKEQLQLIVEELLPDIWDIAGEQSIKLPKNYETSDLLNSAVIKLLESLPECKSENEEEFVEFCVETIGKAVIDELSFIAGPPKQRFIDQQQTGDLKKALNNIDENECEAKGKREKNKNENNLE